MSARTHTGFGTRAGGGPETLGVVTEVGPLTGTAASAWEAGERTGLTALTGLGADLSGRGSIYELLRKTAKYASFVPKIDALYEDNVSYFPGLTKDDVARNWLAKRKFVNQVVAEHPEFVAGDPSDSPERLSRSFVLILTDSGSILGLTPGVEYHEPGESAAPTPDPLVTRRLPVDAADLTAAVIPGEDLEAVGETRSVLEGSESLEGPGGEVAYIQIDKRKSGVAVGARGGIVPNPISASTPNTHVSVRTGTWVKAEDGSGHKEFKETSAVPVVGSIIRVESSNAAGEVQTPFYTTRVAKIFFLENPVDADALLHLLEGGLKKIDDVTMSRMATAVATSSESSESDAPTTGVSSRRSTGVGSDQEE